MLLAARFPRCWSLRLVSGLKPRDRHPRRIFVAERARRPRRMSEKEREREGERSDQSELRRRLRGREEGKEEGAAQGDIGWEIEGDIGSCSCC